MPTVRTCCGTQGAQQFDYELPNMPWMPSRYIHSRLSSRQVPDLLQAIFVAELMTPSRCLWLVSPCDAVKSADTSVRSQIIDWNDKVREYLREFFDSDIEHVQGTEFGDAISKIAYLTEKVFTEPDTFRGVRGFRSIGTESAVKAGMSVWQQF